MPVYVYGCTKNKQHPRKEVVHKITEDPVIQCEACGAKMQRVPQPMTFHMLAFDVLTAWSTEGLRRLKMRKAGMKIEKFSPDTVNMPGRGIPGKDFNYRRARKNANKGTGRTN